jgi:protein ImuA
MTAIGFPDGASTLRRLRQAVAKIEGQDTQLGIAGRGALAFGVPAIDRLLAGGLAPASLHELMPENVRDAGAATGFAAALAARVPGARKEVLWIQTAFAAREAGALHGTGFDLFGTDARRLIALRVRRPIDVLWAMEEALKCRALGCVIAELPDAGASADRMETQRLTLAAREGGGFGFLLRHRPSAFTTVAETRWQVAAAPGRPDRFGGLGRTAFDLSLVKNRRGSTGRWLLAWDHHECVFSPLSFGVAAPAFDRPDRAPRLRAG